MVVCNLKGGEAAAAAPDEMTTSVSDDSGDVLSLELTDVSGNVCGLEIVSFDWCHSLITAVCEERGSDGGMGLTSVVCKSVGCVIMARLRGA